MLESYQQQYECRTLVRKHIELGLLPCMPTEDSAHVAGGAYWKPRKAALTMQNDT